MRNTYKFLDSHEESTHHRKKPSYKIIKNSKYCKINVKTLV